MSEQQKVNILYSLLEEKLNNIEELKKETVKLEQTVLNNDFENILSMLDIRAESIEKNQLVIDKIRKFESEHPNIEDTKIRKIKDDINKVLTDIIKINDVIRLKLVGEMQDITKYNTGIENSSSLNVKM